MRVALVDPSAYTPPYDHALASALASAGAQVELITSEFAYGEVPPPEGYAVSRRFYRHARGPAGSRRRRAAKLAEHVPDMLALRSHVRGADLVHFQWLDVQWLDRWLLPDRPLVLTAHDLLPREPRLGQARAQRRLYEAVDAVIAHSEYGRAQLVERLGLAPERVHVVHHGAFEHLARRPAAPLPAELAGTRALVVLFFGLLRPYKGVEVLLEAWRELLRRPAGGSGLPRAELWIVGRPRMALSALRAAAPPGVRFVPRFVSDAELPAYFRRADIVVLPYLRTERFDFSGVLATALAFAKPVVVSDIGGFGEVARAGGARLVGPGDAAALAGALGELLCDPEARRRLSAGAAALAAGPYSWAASAERTLALYRRVTGNRRDLRSDRTA
jgi:glycosyltransferase involved in cell wall biosynthesis